VGFRFRRSLKLIPGVRLNLSGRGASVSLGVRGFHYTIGSKGARVTAGIPGTGLSWTQYTPYARNFHIKVAKPNSFAPIHSGRPTPSVGAIDLVPIVSAPAQQINALSTSELAPILNNVHRRLRVAPFVIIACLSVLAVTSISGNQTLFALAALHSVIFSTAALLLDRYRRSLKIEYKWGDGAQRTASELRESLAELGRCAALWSITSQGDTSDWKRNAGATKLVKRERIYIRSKRPICIRGGATFPAIKLGAGELFFLPDAALVVTPESVAALRYEDLQISNRPIRYIEVEGVPSDTEVVGQTWRFVAKNGGPDRRFNSNQRLPVCRYGEMDFHSAGGLNGKIQFSNSSSGDRFAKLVSELATPDLSNSGTKPVASFHKTNGLHSLLFCFFLFITGGPLALASLSYRAPASFSYRAPEMRADPPIVSEWAWQNEKARDVNSMNVAPRKREPTNRTVERSASSEVSRAPISNSSTPTDETTIKPQSNPSGVLIDLTKANEVIRVQQRLIELGYLDGAADGKWGPRSRSALQDFRTAMAIGNGSTWDEQTQQQLFSSLAKRSGAKPQVLSSNASMADQQPSSCWIPTNEDFGVGYWGACSDKSSRSVR
jgi:Protein of unknown function (DUF4236)/Putative peptidoglycan binding domain